MPPAWSEIPVGRRKGVPPRGKDHSCYSRISCMAFSRSAGVPSDHARVADQTPARRDDRGCHATARQKSLHSSSYNRDWSSSILSPGSKLSQSIQSQTSRSRRITSLFCHLAVTHASKPFKTIRSHCRTHPHLPL